MGASPWSDQTGGMGGPRGMWGRLTWISTGAWRIIHVKKGESCHQYIQIILLAATRLPQECREVSGSTIGLHLGMMYFRRFADFRWFGVILGHF